MSTDYTPTLDEIREHWALTRGQDIDPEAARRTRSATLGASP